MYLLKKQPSENGIIAGKLYRIKVTGGNFIIHKLEYYCTSFHNWPFPNSILKLRPRLISHQRASNKDVKNLNRCFQS